MGILLREAMQLEEALLQAGAAARCWIQIDQYMFVFFEFFLEWMGDLHGR